MDLAISWFNFPIYIMFTAVVVFIIQLLQLRILFMAIFTILSSKLSCEFGIDYFMFMWIFAIIAESFSPLISFVR